MDQIKGATALLDDVSEIEQEFPKVAGYKYRGYLKSQSLFQRGETEYCTHLSGAMASVMLVIFCYSQRVSFFQRQNYFSKRYSHVHSFRSWNQFVIAYCTLLSLRAAILNCFDGRRISNALSIQGVSRKAKKKKSVNYFFGN